MSMQTSPKPSTRHLIAFLLLFGASFCSLTLQAQAARNELIYVGTYTGHGSQGIYSYHFDPETGRTTAIGLVAKTENPTFLAVHPSGRFLYAVNEVDEYEGKPSGAVSAFAIDQKSGALTLLNRVGSLGKGPAHLSVDETGKYLLLANYGGGSVAVFPIGDDGRIGTSTSVVQHSGSGANPERQAEPHAHQIIVSSDNRFALAADLGLDKVLVYRFDAKQGTLSPNNPPFAATEPGAGPRHAAFHPNRKIVYVLNELTSTVDTFSYDARSGQMRELQSLSTLPKDFAGKNTDAEIVVDAKGKFVYASSRGHDSITVFAVNPKTGTLLQVQDISSGGKAPRNFAIDPTGKWLFAANQNSSNIVLFQVDPNTGQLSSMQQVLDTIAPVCVVFVPAASTQNRPR
jgi:6-phosphogluconolactonase